MASEPRVHDQTQPGAPPDPRLGDTATGAADRSGGDDPLPYVQVFRVRDGQIVSFRDYFGPRTAAALAAGLGAAPAG